MSTQATIAHKPDSWYLQEEMLDDTVWLHLQGFKTQFVAQQNRLKVLLPPDVLDAIAAAHREGRLPHQRTKLGKSGDK